MPQICSAAVRTEMDKFGREKRDWRVQSDLLHQFRGSFNENAITNVEFLADMDM